MKNLILKSEIKKLKRVVNIEINKYGLRTVVTFILFGNIWENLRKWGGGECEIGQRKMISDKIW